MPDLIHFGTQMPDRRHSNGLPGRTVRALTRLEHETVVRVATVQAEGIVQTEKLHEINHLAREAATGHTLLRHLVDTMAHGDAFLADELKVFTDIARVGASEILADTIESFCRESRS